MGDFFATENTKGTESADAAQSRFVFFVLFVLFVVSPSPAVFSGLPGVQKLVLRYFPWLGYEGRLSLPATKYNMVTK
jgi:hypothetical protein